MAGHILRAAPPFLVLLALLCATAAGEKGPHLVSPFKTRPRHPDWHALKSEEHGSRGKWTPCGYLDVCQKCVDDKIVINERRDTPCPDEFFCNGVEKCDGAGKCVAGDPPVCSSEAADWGSIDAQCGEPVCSEHHKACKVEIKPGSCNDNNACTVADYCDLKDGSCKGTPMFCDACHECEEQKQLVTPLRRLSVATGVPDPEYVGMCVDKCPNGECAFGHCKPKVEPPPPGACGDRVCKDGTCTWKVCGECEECRWGTCVEKKCGHCESCVNGMCAPCDKCSVCKWGKCFEKDLGCPSCAPCDGQTGMCANDCPYVLDGSGVSTGTKQVCHAETGTCEDPECTSNSECMGDCDYCDTTSGKCKSRCTGGTVCISGMCKEPECTLAADGMEKACPFPHCQECRDHVCHNAYLKESCKQLCTAQCPDCTECVVTDINAEEKQVIATDCSPVEDLDTCDCPAESCLECQSCKVKEVKNDGSLQLVTECGTECECTDDDQTACNLCEKCVSGVCTEDCPDGKTCKETCSDSDDMSTCTKKCEDSSEPGDCDGTSYNVVCYKCGTDLTCVVHDDGTSISDGALASIEAAFANDCSGGENPKVTSNNQKCADDNSATVVASACLPTASGTGKLSGDCPCSKSDISNIASYTVKIVDDAVCSLEGNMDKCDQGACLSNCANCQSTCLASSIDPYCPK